MSPHTIPLFRICSVCNKELPNTPDFFRRTHYPFLLRRQCHDCENAYKRDYHRKHKEEEHEKNRVWRADHPRTEYYRQYGKEHNAKRQVQKRQRYHANPKNKEVQMVHNRTRKFRLRGAGGHHSVYDIRKQYTNQNGCCYWCSKELNGVYQVDHVIPITRGGTNWPDNLVVACSFCNISKHNWLPYSEWIPPNPLRGIPGESNVTCTAGGFTSDG